MVESCLLLFIVRLVNPPIFAFLFVWLSLIFSDGRLVLAADEPFPKPHFFKFYPTMVTRR